MAILSREEYMNRVHDMAKDSSDETVEWLEDMADTYNALIDKASNSDADDWKKRYEENDRSWRDKYTKRFMSGTGVTYVSPHETDDEQDNVTPETIRPNDLFG